MSSKNHDHGAIDTVDQVQAAMVRQRLEKRNGTRETAAGSAAGHPHAAA